MLKGRFAKYSISLQLLLLLCLIFLCGQFFLGMGIALASVLYGVSFEEVIAVFSDFHRGGSREIFKLVQGISSIGTFLVPSLIAAYLFTLQPARLMGTQRFPKPAWLIGISIVLMAYSMGAISDLLFRLSNVLPWPDFLADNLEQSQEIMLGTYENILNMSGPLDFVQVLIIMAVIPAIAEESLFRGLIQPLLGRNMNRHLAILITSLSFALLHGQHLAFLSIFVLGMVLGYLREWSSSIWPSTILHLINNGVIVVWVYFGDYDYRQALLDEQAIQWAETGVLIAIFITSLFLYRHLSLKQAVD